MSGCNWNLNQIALDVQGQLIGNNCTIDGVVTDTRKLVPGQFFVALKGPNYDAHDFVTAALTAGAVAVMVERQVDIAAPQIDDQKEYHRQGQWKERNILVKEEAFHMNTMFQLIFENR